MTDLFDPTWYADYGTAEECDWHALVLENPVGIQQVRARRTTPQWRLKVQWIRPASSTSDATIEFLRSLEGPKTACYCYTFNPTQRWRNVSVGTGDGSTRSFAFAGRDATSPSLTVASVAKTEGTHYQVGVENQIVYAEDFSQTGSWVAYGGATVTRTASQTDPLGGTTAYRIQTSGGSGTLKLYQNWETTPTAGKVCYQEIWVKNLSATKAVTVSITGLSTQTLAASQDWTQVQLYWTATGAANAEMQFAAPAAGDALDFRVWHPWAAMTQTYFGNPGPSWGFLPTGSAAIAADTTTGKWKVSFYTASIPSSGAIVMSFRGRRLLLGRFQDEVSFSAPSVGRIGYAVTFLGEEQ